MMLSEFTLQGEYTRQAIGSPAEAVPTKTMHTATRVTTVQSTKKLTFEDVIHNHWVECRYFPYHVQTHNI